MMKRSVSAAAAAALGALCGCSSFGGPRLASGPDLPAARGIVRYRETPDRKTFIRLNVKDLADPEKLVPPGYAYVAWVQSDPESAPQNVGALNVRDDSQGELKTLTPLREFKLFVTAESSSDVSKPTGPPLLWTYDD